MYVLIEALKVKILGVLFYLWKRAYDDNVLGGLVAFFKNCAMLRDDKRESTSHAKVELSGILDQVDGRLGTCKGMRWQF